MIFWAGSTGAGVGSAVGFSSKRRRNEQAPLLAAATAATMLILPAAIGEVLS